MLLRKSLWAALFSLLMTLCVIAEAAAQGSSQTTVSGRPRPEDPLGSIIGSFVVFPSLTLGSEYNTNIFATDKDEVDDVIFTISPTLSAGSDWGRHAVGFQGSATFLRYADNTSEDVTNYNLVTNGRVDISRDSNATAGLGVARHHEERGSADDVNGEEPTEFTTISGQLGFSQRFNLLSFDLIGSARRLDYDDVDAAGGGQINNDDRDRDEYGTALQFNYDFLANGSAFVRGSYNLIKYDDTLDDNGFDRDSQNYAAVTGISLDFTGLIFGDFFGGVMHEEPEDSQFSSTTTYSFGGNISWNVTPLTTANFAASRTFEETTVSGASTAQTTDLAASVDHELLPNVLLTSGLSYKLEEFEGTGRKDDTVVFNAGGSYLMNRFVHLGLGYSYTQRFSDADGQDYKEHSIMLTMRLQY